MDLRALRDAAIEATARALLDRLGIVPDEDSDEWEAEYPRQFALLKKRFEREDTAPAAAPGGATAAPLRLPELAGTPEQQRWAATIRVDRLKQVADRDLRLWLATSWTQAKSWIDTRDMPAATFATRARVWHAEGRKHSAVEAKRTSTEQRAEQDAAAALLAKVRDAGITPEGLIELVDASARVDPAPLAAKLADIAIPRRRLRLYETTDPAVLLVKEKTDREQLEYGIERDDGLVADLKLYAQIA